MPLAANACSHARHPGRICLIPQCVSGGSLHFAGVTKKGRVVSSISRGGEKAAKLLDVPPGELPAVAVVAGAHHVAALNEAGRLMVWSVEDNYSANGAVIG